MNEEIDLVKSFQVSVPAGLVALLWTIIQGYKSQLVDDKLPGFMKWSTWPRWGKSAFVFSVSFIGAVATAMTGGLPWATALASAVGVALTAMGSSDLLRKDDHTYHASEEASILVKQSEIVTQIKDSKLPVN